MFCTPGCPLWIPSYQHRAWAPGGAQKGTDGRKGERKNKQREGTLSPTRQDWVMTGSPLHTYLGWPRCYLVILGIYSVPDSVLLLQVLWRTRQVQPSPCGPYGLAGFPAAQPPCLLRPSPSYHKVTAWYVPAPLGLSSLKGEAGSTSSLCACTQPLAPAYP